MNNKILKRPLPSPEKKEIKLGYMRLSDSAPLILSQELGLFSKYDLTVSLKRDVSWANIRDKVITGALDASQMLAPMPLVTTLGAAGIRAPIITGLALSLNGNGITLSPDLWKKLSNHITNCGSPYFNQRSKEEYLKTNKQITFATVHPFSTHTFLLRFWLKSRGIDPDKDVKIIVLPPEQMVDSIAQGVIDGFCAGEPWNSIAVSYGVGVLAASGSQIWNNATEKVLGVLEDWHLKNPATHLRLRLALMEACEWLADMNNRELAIKVISKPEYLDISEHSLRPSLTGKIAYNRVNDSHDLPNFHVFSKYNAGFPWRSQAELMLKECENLLGKEVEQAKISSISQQCYRTDLYREAARHLNITSPDSDYKTETITDQFSDLNNGINESETPAIQH